MAPPLHIVHAPGALDRCLARATPGSAVLLLEDGVYAGLAAGDRPFFALTEDLAARGLSPADLPANVTAIDIRGFVALTTRHHPAVSWF